MLRTTLFKSKSISHPLAIDERSISVKIEYYEVGPIFLQLRSNLSITVDFFVRHKHSGSDEIGSGLIFICVGFSFAFI